jgi:hypothetical protein
LRLIVAEVVYAERIRLFLAGGRSSGGVRREVQAELFNGETQNIASLHSVLLVNQVDHQLYHYILILRLTFGNKQGQSHQGIVGEAAGAVGFVEAVVLIHEPHEQNRRSAKLKAAMRLLPSEKEWFFTTK